MLNQQSERHVRVLCAALLKRNSQLGEVLAHLSRNGGLPELAEVTTCDVFGAVNQSAVAAVEALLADLDVNQTPPPPEEETAPEVSQ
jgi:hypothetical protein